MSASKVLRTVVISLLLAVGTPCHADEASNEDASIEELEQQLSFGATQHTFGDYSYIPEVGKDSRALTCRIKKGGRVLFKYKPYYKGLGACWIEQALAPSEFITNKLDLNGLSERLSKPGQSKLPAGTDVTGDGIPDLIIGVWTGGAHCCYNYTILSLGPKFKKLGTIHGLDSEFTFIDLDGDGACEAVGADFNFRYWNECFAYSPAPVVILSLKGGKLHLAHELMTKNLSVAEFEKRIAKLKAIHQPKGIPADSILVSSGLWAAMLDLIYSGNGDRAWELFNQLWPSNATGYWVTSSTQNEDSPENKIFDPSLIQSDSKIERKKFLSTFKAQLAKSEYWPAIRKMNGW
ncbi:MAG: hypothetical protein KC777_16655 [Cyanobacteria bacterium HKST-UBA02]|nr:hypothetical protein [Cyanobacteria bacterium HKST-UBA02]